MISIHRQQDYLGRDGIRTSLGDTVSVKTDRGRCDDKKKDDDIDEDRAVHVSGKQS